MFLLFDSRDRARTGRRVVYRFTESPTGLRAVWDLVLRDEIPDEYDDYIGLAEWLPDEQGWPHFDPSEVFNDYWSVYGWYLNAFDDDMPMAGDVDVKINITLPE